MPTPTRGRLSRLAALALLACGCNRGDSGYGFQGGMTEGTEGGNPPPATSGTADDGAADSTAGKLDVAGTGMMSMNPEFTSGCATVQAQIEPVIPTIVLLIDRSGSMSEDFGGISRWDAVRQTLLDPGGVVDTLQSEVEFGMALYTGSNGAPPCPMLDETPAAFDNRAAMAADFSMPLVEGDTPTGEALAAVAEGLAAAVPDRPKGIVLATDGEPDTCTVPDPQTGQPESVAAAQGAFDMGVETFVVSVGADVSAMHLQDLANAGAGKPLNDPDPAPYYLALDAAELAGAFDEIVGGFVSCTFTVDGIIDLDLQCEGTVLVDGVELQCPVQWHAADESTLELLGEACAAIQDGAEHTVEATFPCEAFDPIG